MAKTKPNQTNKINEMILNNILLYSQMGAQPNYHQRGFIQQQTGADGETHIQTLDRPQGIWQKRRRKDCKNQWGQGYHKNMTHRINHTVLKQQSESLYGYEPGPLNICYTQEALCSSETLNNASLGSLTLLSALRILLLDCLIQP